MRLVVGSTKVALGRRLICTTCGWLIDLIEIPEPDPTITDETFVCVTCLTPVDHATRPQNIHGNIPERPRAPWETAA